MNELIIFDSSGVAKAFVSEGVFYDYGGRPLAFLDGENIVSYSGRHFGWFRDGYIRDEHGDAVGFTEGARGGPITPIPAIPPIPPIPSIPPIPTIPPILPIPPIFSFSWSSRTLDEFFDRYEI